MPLSEPGLPEEAVGVKTRALGVAGVAVTGGWGFVCASAS